LAKIVKQSVAYNFGAGLYTTFFGERVLVVVMFNATSLPMRPYCEKYVPVSWTMQKV